MIPGSELRNSFNLHMRKLDSFQSAMADHYALSLDFKRGFKDE